MRSTGSGNRPALTFFALTFAWSWALWWGAVAAGVSFAEPSFQLLYLLGVFGPFLGAARAVVHGDRDYRSEFFRRVCDPRRIPARGWLALIFVAAGPAVLGAVAARASGTATTIPDYSAGSVVAVIGFALVAGLAEEPGWRGAASDAWQGRMRPLWAALGIGALWSVWHLPLYFVEGSYQHGIGFASVRFWLGSVALVQLGVLYVWLANGAGGSVLIAILAHAGFNIAGELVPSSTLRDVVAFFIITAATVGVIAGTRGRLQFAMASEGSGNHPDFSRGCGIV